MANAREILSRMNSVRDTRKITNAMYLISSNKLRKSKQMLEDTEPYFYTMQAVIQRILRHIPDIQHPYFADSRKVEEKDRSRALVVITGDKGLAGAYNHNGAGNESSFICGGRVGASVFCGEENSGRRTVSLYSAESDHASGTEDLFRVDGRL